MILSFSQECINYAYVHVHYEVSAYAITHAQYIRPTNLTQVLVTVWNGNGNIFSQCHITKALCQYVQSCITNYWQSIAVTCYGRSSQILT